MPSLCYVKSSPYGLLSYLLYDPQGAASCLLTPSNARWVTATNLLPSLPILHTRHACVSEGLTATWQYRNPCLKNVGSKTNKSYRTSQVNYIIANWPRDYNCKFWQNPFCYCQVIVGNFFIPDLPQLFCMILFLDRRPSSLPWPAVFFHLHL